MSKASFVGRSNEQRDLIARMGQPGSMTLVLGEAGIGKSTLVQEAAAQTGRTTLVGHAWAGGKATPYLPWMQIAAAAAAILNPREHRFSTRFVDAATLFSQGDARRRFEGDDTSRHLLALGLADYLRELSETAGTMLTLVIEDVHASDPHSIELLSRIAGQSLPLSLVVSSRPLNEAAIDIRPQLDALFAQSELLALGPLGRIGVLELLSQAGIGEAHYQAAIDASAGVPLLVHSWIAERHLGDPVLGRPGIAKRLADLNEATIDMLRYGSLIGNEFDGATLMKVTGMSTSACLAGLDQAEDAGLIDRKHSWVAVFTFHHETFRQAISQEISLTERAQRHAKLLQLFLAARGSAGERELSELADHAAGAAFVGDAQLAVELNLQAAEDALARAAPMVAHHHFQRAAELTELAGSSRQVRFLAELGSLRALKETGHVEAKAETIELLNRCGADPDLDDVFVDAVLLLPTSSSGMGVAPDVQPTVKAWVARALERIGAETSPRRVQLLIELGLQSRDGNPEEFGSLSTEAMRLAEELGDARLKAHAYTAHRSVCRAPGEGNAILERVEGLEREVATSDNDALFWLSGLRITTLLRMGELGLALREVNRLEHELAPLPPVVAWLLGRYRALLQFARADFAASEATALAAYEVVSGGHHDEVALEFLQMQLSPLLRVQAQPELVEPILLAMVAKRPEFLGYRAALAWVLADNQKPSEARPHLAHVFASDLADRGRIEWLPLVSLATAAAAELGEREWCRQGFDLLEPYRDEWILFGTSNVTEGPVSLRLGLAALGMADLVAAKSNLASAREAIVAANAVAFEPELLHHEAVLADLSGDAGRASVLMSNASACADRLGLERLAAMFAAHAFELAARIGEVRSQPTAEAGPEAVFRRDGATWTVGLGGERASVAHVKGMLAVAALLDNPGREITATQVAAIVDGLNRGSEAGPHDRGFHVGSTEDALVDPTALAQYRTSIVDLENEIAEAARFNDSGRRLVAQQELDALVEHLAKSTGLGGKSRQTVSGAERVRVRVTKSIRTAVNRISEVAPLLGQHLSASIRTGTYCSYSPDALTEITWTR